nr:MAG TPA: hypothetical protein [Caudoviricetes sp.]
MSPAARTTSARSKPFSSRYCWRYWASVFCLMRF